MISLVINTRGDLRVGSPEGSGYMGLTSNGDLRAILDVRAVRVNEGCGWHGPGLSIHPEMKMNMEGKEPKG